MPYPPPDHRDYCAGSEQPVPTLTERPDAIWHRCPSCGRLIAAKPSGRFFPHLNHPTRRGDAVQEGLEAAGANRRDILRPDQIRYAEPAGAPRHPGCQGRDGSGPLGGGVDGSR